MATAMKGPLIVYGQRPPIGTGATGSENPYLGPSLMFGGASLLDTRVGYNNVVAGATGWVSADVLALDVIPATLAANNIAASQSPAAGAITLVSATGAGVTVLSAAQYMPAANTTIPINTLALDGNSATLLGYGRASSSNSGQFEIKSYDPSLLLSRTIRLVSGGNDSGITFTVSGYDIYGVAMTETITGANAGTASGAKAWKFITGVTHTGSVAGTLTIGTNDVIGFPFQVLRFGRLGLVWNNAWITANTGFTAAVTTSPATALTGDVRGTYALQSASDGTKSLQVYLSMPPAVMATNYGAASMFGVAQA